MSDAAAGAISVFLQPGELFTGDSPALVKTVLGSCVAILMRVPRAGSAAMAHCLLPEAGVPVDTIPRRLALRFVDTTVELMIRAMVVHGARFDELEVKLFGGAGRIYAPGVPAAMRVGQRNVETALAELSARGLRIAARSVGGERGRLIEFDTSTGEVRVKILPVLGGGIGESA